MFNLFKKQKQDQQEAMLQLIVNQKEVIELQRQALSERDEIIKTLKRIITICEQQIELEKLKFDTE